MTSPRVRKIADRIQVIVAEMLERRIKDPRLGFATITDVRVTGDTQQATIFYTVLGEDEQLAGTAAALESAKGLIRSEVGKQLGMRHVPTLTFVPDALPESARHLDEVLAKARAQDEAVAAARVETYAGEADPYKKPREVAEDDDLDDGRLEPPRGVGPAGHVTAGPGPTGLVVVDKPGGLTSHDVVARARRALGTRKVGHAGTLDPMATGVLVLGVGRATRLLGHLTLTEKAYDATARLGVATTTDDAEGEVVGAAPAGHLGDDEIRAALAGFVGDIEQVPTAVSAIKVDGRRAYERVRAGEEVELAARPVTVHELVVHEVRAAADVVDVDFSVRCSSGTYVRAIARDLGAALGVGGHLTALRRTAVGAFDLSAACTLDDLAERGAGAARGHQRRGQGDLRGVRPRRRAGRRRARGPAARRRPAGGRAGGGVRARRGVPRPLRATRPRSLAAPWPCSSDRQLV